MRIYPLQPPPCTFVQPRTHDLFTSTVAWLPASPSSTNAKCDVMQRELANSVAIDWRIDMRSNNLLLFACAVSAALAVSACHRDEADEADHAAATTAVAPAPAPAPDAMASVPSVVASTEPMVDTGMTFEQMDQNHDGSVTADELHDNDMLKQHFAEADSNGDGKLSADEVAKHKADMAAKPGG